MANRNIRRFALNTGALVFEQFLRAALNVVLGVYVARYLGPSQYGTFNYVIAIVTIASAVARLGIDGTLVRELLTHPNGKNRDLGTAFWLMAAGSLAAGIACLGLSLSDTALLGYTVLALSMVAVQPFVVIDLFCQSEIKATIPAMCRIGVFLLGSALKLWAVISGQPLYSFFVITLVEQTVLVLLYALTAVLLRINGFWLQFSMDRAKFMLRSSWPVLVTAIALSNNVRITQVLVSTFSSAEVAGVFAAASRIFEAWIYLPYVCVLSVAPALVKARTQSATQYHRLIELLVRFLFWASIGLALVFAVFGNWITAMTFGQRYMQAATPLAILMFASAFSAIGSISGQYFIWEHRSGALLRRTLVAAGTNVVLCCILVPVFGGTGAAISLFIALFLANYAVLWITKTDKALLRSINRGIIPGYRSGNDGPRLDAP